MIMVGAGTGLAPFRGFLQERARAAGPGRSGGPSLLFFGCRNAGRSTCSTPTSCAATRDRGLVRVENAFSRATDAARRYVQDAMLDCADEVWDLLRRDAAVFVCGNASTIAPGVRSALTRIFRGQDRDRRGRRPGLARRPADDRPVRGGHLGG